MKNIKLLLLILFTLSPAFSQLNIETKFMPPAGYERIYNDTYSTFLRQLPLKEHSTVLQSDGTQKLNYIDNNEKSDLIWVAVFDYELGIYKTHQCADAAIYLNAMYKYKQSVLVGEIKYHFTNGDIAKYQDWLDGVNYKLDSNNDSILHKEWKSTRTDNIDTFQEWIKVVWEWAGTASLPLDTMPINIEDMMPGDVFNKNGHAISVVDVVVNKDTGHKKYMLAQSYMPAYHLGEEHHILINQKSENVWYDLNPNDKILTPEWEFEPTDISRFKK